MRLSRQAMMAGILLSVIAGCTVAREPGGANIRWVDSGGTKGEYKPWNDVNNQPLPRTWWSTRGYGPPWQSGAFYSDNSTPPLR
jgi:hypothetical protein